MFSNDDAISLRNWVFTINWNFLIPISLQPDGEHLWYFKFRLFNLTEFIAWNIKDKKLKNRVCCKNWIPIKENPIHELTHERLRYRVTYKETLETEFIQSCFLPLDFPGSVFVFLCLQENPVLCTESLVITMKTRKLWNRTMNSRNSNFAA